VLGLDLLAGAFARMSAGQADALIAGLRALVDTAGPSDIHAQGDDHDALSLTAFRRKRCAR
jgi:hypothetical protein